jgi:hypothetical protein
LAVKGSAVIIWARMTVAFLSLLVRRSRSSRELASARDQGAASSTATSIPSPADGQHWRSSIDSDARDLPSGLLNVCPILR